MKPSLNNKLLPVLADNDTNDVISTGDAATAEDSRAGGDDDGDQTNGW